MSDRTVLTRAVEMCTQRRTAIDGGANVGVFTAYLAQKFNEVLAFEPAPETFRWLECGAPPNVQCEPYALGDISKMVGLTADPTCRIPCEGMHVVKGEDVQMRRLDFYPLMGVDFIKLDIEGYELMALKGAEATIRMWRPVIMLEQKARPSLRYGIDYREPEQWLMARGYRQAPKPKQGKDYIYLPEEIV